MGPDPGSPAYEAARKRLAKELWRIGATDERNGFTLMASELMAGALMEVPTWVALQLLATPPASPDKGSPDAE